MGYRVPGLAKDPTEQYLEQLRRVSEEQRSDLRDMSRSNVDYIDRKYAAPVEALDKGVDSYRTARSFAEEQNKWGRAAAQEERAKGQYGMEQGRFGQETQLNAARLNEAEQLQKQRAAEEAVMGATDSSGKSFRQRSAEMRDLKLPESQMKQADAQMALAKAQQGTNAMLTADTMKTSAQGREMNAQTMDEQKIAAARNVFTTALTAAKTQGAPYDRNAIAQLLLSSSKYTPQQIAEAERGASVDPARVQLANANLTPETLKLADDADKYAQFIDQNKRAVAGYKANTGAVFESDVSGSQLEEMAKRMEATGLDGLAARARQLRGKMGGKIINAMKSFGSNQPVMTSSVVDASAEALENELIQDLESRIAKVPVEERSLPKVSKAIQTLAALKAQQAAKNKPQISQQRPAGSAPPPPRIQNASMPGDMPAARGVSKYRPQTEGGR